LIMSETPETPLSPYREFLAEREEVLRHKWILSEEARRDVGLETALVDWALRHREAWKLARGRHGGEA
jgi:hypothetical protein